MYFPLIALACIVGVLQASVVPTMKRIARDNFVKLSRAQHDTTHALVFAVQQRNLDFLDKKLIEISTPGNANYQQWLTYDEIGEITSNQQGAQEVLNWLDTHGARVVWTTNHNDYIKAEAPISTWERLLHAEFYEFHDQSRQTKKNNGLAKYLRADQYTMPAEIKSHLSAVFHTVQTPPEMRQRYHTAEEASSQQTNFRTDYTISKTNFRGSSNKATLGQGVVTVQFLNEYYHISNNTGSALLQQAVFETGEEHYSPNDLTQFQNTFGLPVQDAEAPFGYTTTDCVGNSCYEGNLDVQYIMGVAQQTTSVYWYQPDTTTSDPFVDWATDVANSTNPPLSNSISWGSIEQGSSTDTLGAFNTEAMKLAAMGVTVMVSSGDDGVAADPRYCNFDSSSSAYPTWTYTSSWTGRGYFPSFPATSPYVTTLGATQGPESGDAEVACQANTGGVITTGGGFSTYNPTPSWQVDAVNAYFDALTASNTPTSGYNRNGRGYPDVSLIGVWYQVVVQGEFISLFGTSASAPVFAAMISLINAARAANNMSSVGFINPTLYAYGQANTFGVNGTSFAPYNDVTQGDNTCTSGTNPPVCCDSGFYASAGWDPVTGFGSVFYPNLAQMFNVTATYVASPSSNGSGNKLSTAAVVGIVLAVIFVVAMLIGACVACCCACNKPPPPQMTQQMAPVPAQVYETQNPVATGTYARPPGAV